MSAAPASVFWAQQMALQSRRRQKWLIKARKARLNELPGTVQLCVRFARECHRFAMSARANIVEVV